MLLVWFSIVKSSRCLIRESLTLKKARCLQRLTLLLHFVEDENTAIMMIGDYIYKLDLPLLHELKVVGFSGRGVECGLAMMFGMAIRSLEKVTLRQRCFWSRFCVFEDELLAKRREIYPDSLKHGIGIVKEGLRQVDVIFI